MRRLFMNLNKKFKKLILFALILTMVLPTMAFARETCPNFGQYDKHDYVKTIETFATTYKITNVHSHMYYYGVKDKCGCNPHVNVEVLINLEEVKNYHIWMDSHGCFKVWESKSGKEYKKCTKDMNEAIKYVLEEIEESASASNQFDPVDSAVFIKALTMVLEVAECYFSGGAVCPAW